MSRITPTKRHDHLLVQELDGELVIYDQKSNHAHRLNLTAGSVWKACDGQSTTEQIAQRAQLGETFVYDALSQLEQAQLLETSVPRQGLSGKQMAGLAAGVAIMAPVVESLVAPTAAAAGSF